MRSIPVLAVLAAATLGCMKPITVVSLSPEKLEKGAGITLLVSQPDPIGAEHAIARALKEGGFDVFSTSFTPTVTRPAGTQGEDRDGEMETLRKLKTRYLCRVKTFGYGTTIRSFTVQLVNVESSRVVLSLNGQDGSYAPDEIAGKLLASLQ
jgi:hypothetical protein